MRIFGMIIFFIFFFGFLIWYFKTTPIEIEEPKKEEASNRDYLEMENTEFDYGHNVSSNLKNDY